MFFKKKKHIEQLTMENVALQCANKNSIMKLPETIFDKDGNEYVLLIGDLGDFEYVPKCIDSEKT